MDWMNRALSGIKNALMAKKTKVVIRGTKNVLSVLRVMKAEGFIKDYYLIDRVGKFQSCEVVLSYYGNESVIRTIKSVSKPSLAVYIGFNELKPYLKHFKMPIVSTSKGVLSAKEAIDSKVGGKFICEVS